MHEIRKCNKMKNKNKLGLPPKKRLVYCRRLDILVNLRRRSFQF